MAEFQRFPQTSLDWIAKSVGLGARVQAVQAQGGATSSTLNKVDVLYRGRLLRLMLRRYTNQEWLLEEPGVASHEAENLQTAQAAGIPVPELVACDPDGSQVGTPAILMTRLPGKVDLLPADLDGWLRQQAQVLGPLHAVEAAGYPWRYAPYNSPRELAVPGWSKVPRLWERALEIVNSPPPPTRPCFIHRDYHPVNVLFQDGQLSGLIDWPNACLGPPGIDVSWSRANLAAMLGVAAAERFLAHYQTAAGSLSGYHPYWDLMVIIDGLPGPPDVYPPWVEFGMPGLTPARMLQRSEAYLASVMAKLGQV